MAHQEIAPYLERCRVPPYRHQVEGIAALVAQPIFALFDEMGAGKTLQVIVAAQILHALNVIDRVIVVAPASVRSVWYDPELGELRKHLWADAQCLVTEYHGRTRQWATSDAPMLRWVITNYDYIRHQKARQWSNLGPLLAVCGPKTLLVLDESSAVKSHKAKQTEACQILRRKCGRVILLNGTPIANHPGDMFSQGNMLDPRILACPSYTQYCARYAIMKPVLGHGGKPILSPRGFPVKTAVGWSNIEDIQRRFAPYVLRRLKVDCLDLPPKLPTVILTPTLTPTTWRAYKEMRDELVVWLSEGHVSMAPQIITKVLRLAQITSGFLGGVEEMAIDDSFRPSFLPPALGETPALSSDTVQEIGREKLDLLLEWHQERLEEDPNFKLLVFSRFRAELLRAARECRQQPVHVGLIIGGQKPADRTDALRLLDPRTMPSGPVIVFCSIGAGSMGLNLTGAHTVLRMSNDFNLKNRLQGDDRVHRPGQIHAVSYFDIVAVGPQGQKTVDHATLAALLRKEDLATTTTSAWVRMLRDE